MTTTTRISQGERTRVLRLRLLEATVECLVEPGYAHTTTTMVSERAAVSRGAQLHHVPTKNDLVVAAVEQLTLIRGAEMREKVVDLAESSDEMAASTVQRITRLRHVPPVVSRSQARRPGPGRPAGRGRRARDPRRRPLADGCRTPTPPRAGTSRPRVAHRAWTDEVAVLPGGTGHMHGTEVERRYRDARNLRIGGGATKVLTDLAVKLLGCPR